MDPYHPLLWALLSLSTSLTLSAPVALPEPTLASMATLVLPEVRSLYDESKLVNSTHHESYLVY